MADDPLSDLIDALRQGTGDKSLQWEQADSYGSAFIARRSSGTVTLQGRQPGHGLGIGTSATVRLVVKDAAGKTIEQYDAVEASPFTLAASGLSAAMMGKASPDARLVALWWDVREQLTKARSTMRALAKEFKASE